ncbi:MAG TPA: hypothetical protein VIM55_20830 [Mucilaginibacter sp.]
MDMGVAEIKSELIDRIEHADANQLTDLYGLIANYFGSQVVIGGEVDELSDYQKQRLETSIQQAKAGLGTPAIDAVRKARKKYGLNG